MGDRAEPGRPVLTGTPFNDAYRYMDWLLTVPLLLIEIILVMTLSPEESNKQCWRLGVLSALMILSACSGDVRRPRGPRGARPPGAHRDSVQRRLPLHGLAPHRAAAADRDHSGDDPDPGGVQQAVLAPRRSLGPDDPLRVQG